MEGFQDTAGQGTDNLIWAPFLAEGPFPPGLGCESVLSECGTVQSHMVCSLFGKDDHFPQVYSLYEHEPFITMKLFL